MALAIPGAAGFVPAASAAEATPPPVAVEDFIHPGAAKILAERNITLKAGDGHIQLADCASGPGLVQLYSRAADPSLVCFRITGPRGYLALQIPQIYNIKGDDHTVTAKINTSGNTTEFQLDKNNWKPVGEGSSGVWTTLLELNAVDGPAGPAPTTDNPAVGTVTAGQPGHSTDAKSCTATLVDRRWVLTAATCVADDTAAKTATIDGRTIRITNVERDAGRDVAMAQLADPVDGVTPVPVASAAPVAGESLRVPGYGRSDSKWLPTSLHTTTHTVGAVSATGFESAPTPGSAAICAGDAGAPLLRTVDGTARIVGVASRSWQGGCLGSTDTRTGAANSRVEDLGAWIKEVRYRTADVKPGTHVQVLGSDSTLWDTATDHRTGRWADRWSAVGISATAGTQTAVDSVAIGNAVHVYAIGTDGRVYTRDGAVGGTWSAWQEVPGGAGGVQDITATTRGNTVSLQVIGSDGRLHTTNADYSTGQWDPHWVKVDDNAVKAITSSTTPDNTVHVYAIGTDLNVYTRDNKPDGTWSTWQLVPGGASGVQDITATTRGNTVSLQVIGSDGRLHTTNADYATGQWDPHWVKVDDNAVKAITSSTTPDNTVHVYAIGTDLNVYTRDNKPDGTWSTWQLVPGGASGVQDITATAVASID
ncbi:trypsin-like serine protease [Kitasatospora sp. NPDC005856]|uniref:trypsin-like serine protease n=1 Tax=Kitasatospora sp. NPDC005856 TaxID=3154566 RepID=UPI0033E715D2